MIAIGILLLLAAVGLIWFRTPLTGTRIGDGDIPFSIYIVNQSGQTTLLWIAGLIGLLGIGLIVAGLIRPKRIAAPAGMRINIPPVRKPQVPPDPVFCSICKTSVFPDCDHRCPSCGWST